MCRIIFSFFYISKSTITINFCGNKQTIVFPNNSLFEVVFMYLSQLLNSIIFHGPRNVNNRIKMNKNTVKTEYYIIMPSEYKQLGFLTR